MHGRLLLLAGRKDENALDSWMMLCGIHLGAEKQSAVFPKGIESKGVAGTV